MLLIYNCMPVSRKACVDRLLDTCNVVMTISTISTTKLKRGCYNTESQYGETKRYRKKIVSVNPHIVRKTIELVNFVGTEI